MVFDYLIVLELITEPVSALPLLQGVRDRVLSFLSLVLTMFLPFISFRVYVIMSYRS